MMDILSLELQCGLKRCSNQSLVSDAFWEVILKSVTGTLSGNCEDSSRLSTFHTKEDISKQCFASMLSLIVESARHNLDEAALSSLLANHNFSRNRLQNVFDCFNSHKLKLQKLLYNVSFELPILSDVHWKLCYRVDASCSRREEDRVLFFIQIDTQHLSMKPFEKTVSRKLTFVCTVQKLQEMVRKLKESCRHIENLINSLK